MALDFEDLATTVYGEVAIVNGRNIIRGRAGEPATSQLRFTQVWMRRHGAWQGLAYHASPMLPGLPAGCERAKGRAAPGRLSPGGGTDGLDSMC